MRAIEREIARRVKAMTRKQVMMHAIAGKLTWIQVAEICRITARQLRRMKPHYEAHGHDGLVAGRGGKPRRTRIAVKTLEELCRSKRAQYADVASVRSALRHSAHLRRHDHFAEIPAQ
jgi:hypothetical protein